VEYSNRQPPEGINASLEHPLKEFAWLTASVLAFFLLLIVVIFVLVDALCQYIPFEVEQRLMSEHVTTQETAPELQQYLDDVAVRLSAEMDLPEGMQVRVHYLDEDTVNAFATLGGQILLCRGLLAKLPHENALAMVLAHEIAHVKNRDPIQGAGRGVVLALALAMVSSQMGNGLLEQALSHETNLAMLKYSRDQESSADVEALAALQGVYGHVNGADALFRVLEEEKGGLEIGLEFFSTHPFTENRIARVAAAAATGGAEQAVTPLPQAFAGWLRQGGVDGGVRTEPCVAETGKLDDAAPACNQGASKR